MDLPLLVVTLVTTSGLLHEIPQKTHYRMFVQCSKTSAKAIDIWTESLLLTSQKLSCVIGSSHN